MKKRSIFSFVAAAGAAMYLAGAPVASAASPVIDAAISAGVIGEQADGYLGVVSGKSADAATKRTMEDTNIKRKTVYTQLAAQKGVTVAQVAAVTAEKQIAKLPAGAYYQDGTGTWVRK
ncbi:MAG: YdbL family protein [Caulobacterales bacterium]